jgi:hypothetical protein
MLKYRKNKVPDLGKHLNVTSLQNYIPLYKRFFSLNSTNWNSINLDNPVLELSMRENSLHCKDTPLFFKFSPLLDPLKYLTGSYDDYDFSLPTPVKSYPPLDDFNNSSYVDAFFSFLSSRLLNQGFNHGNDFYGSYLGIKEDFSYNIEDDLDHIEESEFFHKNKDTLFTLNREFSFSNSRKNKSGIQFSDEDVELKLDSLDSMSESESEYSDNGMDLHAIIKKFPVQVIALEKYEDTLDSLLDDIHPDELTSALMQIIMILITYQNVYQFTHNDLHTNNVMFVSTDLPYLHYYYKGIYYKVPTFGKLFKLIDYGRAIYTFQNKRFVSNSFHEDGDAATQYNLEPFFDCSEPPIPPNYSFDLCRLACSILEGIQESDGIYKVVEEWSKDDNGESVLLTPEGFERYPDFELYRMIARTVHHHTPDAQLERPLFKAYQSDPVPDFINIHAYDQ